MTTSNLDFFWVLLKRHLDDSLHQSILTHARLWLQLDADPGSLGITLCSDCDRAYKCERWPADGERISISHGLCDECENVLFPAEEEDVS